VRRFIGWLSILVVTLALVASHTAAATLEPIGAFERPIFITSDPGDPNRLLVVEREGMVIEVSPAGTHLFADVSSLVSCCAGERGLLSIAPAPDFDASGRFYAAYTGTPAAGGREGDVHVDSFRPDAGGGKVFREPILSIDHSQQSNHNGGQLQLGPDGNLYVSTGDGGGGGDPFENGQNDETLLGKILRIDPRPGWEPPYAIPPGNPFAGIPGRDEIWALGLRNPWRFSFDRASGDMVIADVGQGAREELDYASSPAAGVVSGAGANYGWNCREGTIPYPEPATACATASGFTEPVFDYPHEDPEDGSAHGCSIIGGYVARDPSLGDLSGRYVYSDFCAGEIRSLRLPAGAGGAATDDRSEGLHVSEPTSFGEDACGRLYVVSAEGPVYRFVGASPASCPSPAASPAPSAPIAGPERKRKPKPGHRPKPERRRLRLSALPLGGSAVRFRFVARLSPCGDGSGRKVHLKRDGHGIRARALNRRCVVRFRLFVRHRASFRAVLSAGPRGVRLRSPRLVVGPG
jgi:glucose/sorbosone dehydrogenase